MLSSIVFSYFKTFYEFWLQMLVMGVNAMLFEFSRQDAHTYSYTLGC